MFEKFFGKSENDNVHKESDLERERLEQEAERELLAIDLSKQTILELAPGDTHKLDSEIFEIKAKIPRDAQHEIAIAREIPQFPEDLRKLGTPEEIIRYIVSLKGREKEFLHRIILDMHLDYAIAEKLKEYDKSRWQEVMKEVLEKGNPQFSREPNLLVDFYKKKGIDIINPTAEDAEKYFDSLHYTGASISGELGRRRLADFNDIGEDRELAIQELFWNFMKVPDKRTTGFSTLTGLELEAKLNELESKL